jgi:hypothetical protein
MMLGACALLTTMNACVIPVAPQFDDPEENFPPFVSSSDPGVGETFTPGQDEDGGARFITVTLGDHNLGDSLFLRWLLDYPGANPEGGQLVMVATLPPTKKTDRSPDRYAPSCSSRGSHTLVLSVSDRKFLDTGNGESVSPDAPRDSYRKGANRMRAVWILNCP